MHILYNPPNSHSTSLHKTHLYQLKMLHTMSSRVARRAVCNRLAPLASIATQGDDHKTGAICAAVLMGLGLVTTTSEDAKCCGIMGVMSTETHKSDGTDKDARSLLLEGLSILRNRGYDSAGIATSSESGLVISKYASRGSNNDSFEILQENLSLIHI